MDLEAFDIFVLLLLAIVVSIVIGINVTYVIDKKMSDMTINIPQCPQPAIYVQTEDGKVTRVLMKRIDSDNGEVVEGFDTMVVRKNDLLDDKQDNEIKSTIIETDTNKPRIYLSQGYHSTPSERNMVNRDEKIMNPDHNDILRYNGPGCFEQVDANKVRRVQLSNKPDQQRCEDRLNIAAVNTVRTKTLTASGNIVDKHVNFYVPQTYLGAAGQRSGMPTGYPEIDGFTRDNGQPADVDQIGSIPVNNYEGEPVPVGSVLME